MKKFALLLAAAVIGLAGCTTMSTDVPSSNPYYDSTITDDRDNYVLNGRILSDDEVTLVDVMRKQFPTYAELRDTCDNFQAYPDIAWSSFNEGSNGYFTRAEFENAVNYACS